MRATLDLEMPFAYGSAQLVREALEKGFITEEDIDRSATKVIELVEKCISNQTSRPIWQFGIKQKQ